MSLLTGKGVGKSYGDFDVFKNLQFSIEHEDCIGLVGPNGEGKTTLLRLLVGSPRNLRDGMGELKERGAAEARLIPRDQIVEAVGQALNSFSNAL